MNKRDGQMMKMRRAFFSAAKVKYELKAAPDFCPVSCLCHFMILRAGLFVMIKPKAAFQEGGPGDYP